MQNKFIKPFGLAALILFIDQLIKFYIKTHFFIGEQVSVAGDWFYLHFTENNGMAFGMEIAGSNGKLLLSSFRALAILGLGYYLYLQIKKNADVMLIYTLSLVFAGALGNLIDSCFYGLIFNDSYNQIATFMPAGGGYAPLLFGRVVDMFYFPLFSGQFPKWLPIWGGEYFEFFRPVFNFADASISVGVGLMILFQKRVFGETSGEKVKE